MKRPDATIEWLATHLSGRAVFSVTSTDAAELIAYIGHLERQVASGGSERVTVDAQGVPEPAALPASPYLPSWPKFYPTPWLQMAGRGQRVEAPRYSVTRRADTRWDVYDNGQAKLVDLFTTEAQADAYARYMNDSNMRLPGA